MSWEPWGTVEWSQRRGAGVHSHPGHGSPWNDSVIQLSSHGAGSAWLEAVLFPGVLD